MSVIINGVSGSSNVNGNEFLKSRGREAFVEGGGMRDGRCVYKNVVVGKYNFSGGKFLVRGQGRCRQKGKLLKIVMNDNE